MSHGLNEISVQRLKSQQVSDTSFKTPVELVSWMGAMQAQDYTMAQWALGVRLRATTSQPIQQAMDKGEIIRTHVLRPTWHLVSPTDASWMLSLTSPYIKASLNFRQRYLELTPSTLKRAFGIIEKALTRSAVVTREAMVQRLQAAKINTAEQRAVHILLMAELDQLICSGPLVGKKHTFTLFDQRIRRPKIMHPDEAAGALCRKYFQSHGPATVQDFTWWSGLPARLAGAALESVKSGFLSQKIGSSTYWFKDQGVQDTSCDSLYLLPAFDEFIISYKDRRPSLALSHHATAIASNGIFRPLVVYNGQVIGLWQKTVANRKVVIKTELFAGLKIAKTKTLRDLIKEASAKVAKFYTHEEGPATAQRRTNASKVSG